MMQEFSFISKPLVFEKILKNLLSCSKTKWSSKSKIDRVTFLLIFRFSEIKGCIFSQKLLLSLILLGLSYLRSRCLFDLLIIWAGTYGSDVSLICVRGLSGAHKGIAGVPKQPRDNEVYPMCVRGLSGIHEQRWNSDVYLMCAVGLSAVPEQCWDSDIWPHQCSRNASLFYNEVE